MRPAAIRALIREVPDFPEPGILFRDITPVLAEPAAFAAVVDYFAERLSAAEVDAVLAIESRGFLFGAAAARQLNLPLQLVRKQGKLPGATVGIDYQLEYGSARLELASDAVRPGRRYAIVDDLLATGGTAAAVRTLVTQHDGQVVSCCFMIELAELSGSRHLAGCQVHSLLQL